MKKCNTIHSFQELDPSRFRKKSSDAGKRETLKKDKTSPPLEDVPAIEDEAAMFLAAVAGGIDVSMKNPTECLDALSKSNDAYDAALPPSKRRDDSPRADKDRKTPPDGQNKNAAINVGDENIFARAMDGVVPIRARGRDLSPPTKLVGPAKVCDMTLMEDIFTGRLEFSLEYTEEFVQGHVLGIDPAVLGKLRAGVYSREGHLDLHGQNLEQAYGSLAAFLKYSYQTGKRHVLVITGRGKNSPGGTPVLRERVQAWFTRDPFKRVVLAFCTAKPGDGGAGALYLLLRKRKKSQGKIIWDRMPSEEELLL